MAITATSPLFNSSSSIKGSRKWAPLGVPLRFAAGTLLTCSLFSALFILHAFMPSPSSPPHHHLRLRATSVLQAQPSIKLDLGRFGELMLSFLRPDLPFTIFIPSPSSFESMFVAINGRSNTSLATQDDSNYAIVSRIFGFSAVPRRILSTMVPINGELNLDSVAGFRLNLARLPPKGAVLVNNLECTAVDIVNGSIVVHVVDGILMDSDFEQSVIPFEDEVVEEGGNA